MVPLLQRSQSTDPLPRQRLHATRIGTILTIACPVTVLRPTVSARVLPTVPREQPRSGHGTCPSPLQYTHAWSRYVPRSRFGLVYSTAGSGMDINIRSLRGDRKYSKAGIGLLKQSISVGRCDSPETTNCTAVTLRPTVYIGWLRLSGIGAKVFARFTRSE